FRKLYQQRTRRPDRAEPASPTRGSCLAAAGPRPCARKESTMFATLAAAAALGFAPAQTGTLNLTNVRTTYGELGAVRMDNRYLPGDLFFVPFDIDGIAVGPDGKVSYAMSMEVTDKSGKVIYRPEKPAESNEYLPLGGSKLPARAYILLDI